MSNQPYEGYEGHQGHQGYQGHEGHEGYGGHEGYDQRSGQQYQQPQPQPQPQQYQQAEQYQQPQPQQYPGAQYPEQSQQYAQPYPQQQQPQQYAAYPDQQHYQHQQDQQHPQQQHPHQQYQQPPYPQPYAQDQYTQQWEGQTWETQVQPPVAAVDVTETAYLPAQGAAAQAMADGRGTPPGEPRPPRGSRPSREPAADTPAPAGDTSYGPATTTGNARVTDAQRARAEGRSPVIEPGMQPAALTALLGLLLAGGAAAGQYALLVPLVILQAVTAAGWFRLNGMWPARQGIALAFLGGVVADIVLLTTGEGHEPAAILGTLGVWVLLVLVLQLRSRAGADERMYGLMATVVSSALAIIAAGHLAAVPDAVVVGGVAVAVAILARALPLPTPASVVVALLAAAGSGVAVGGMTDLGGEGAPLALGAAVCALIGHRVASYDYPSRFVHMTAGVALPLAAAAPAVHVLGRAFG
ncbi:Peptidase C83 domain-containing protein OS=Streptomyces alboniger OX=132473 GN=CP975_16400 PE=4 SV=1 [Streptomyces alboniger]